MLYNYFYTNISEWYAVLTNFYHLAIPFFNGYFAFFIDEFPNDVFCWRQETSLQKRKDPGSNSPRALAYPTRRPGRNIQLLKISQFIRVQPENLRTAGASNASGASKAHGALPAFHQDRHFSHPLGKFQHLLQIAGVLYHVPIIHLVAFLAFGLPGLLSVRSTAFTENGDLLGHLVPSLLAADVIDPEIEKIHQVQDDQGILRERVLHPFETGADFLADKGHGLIG